jgi:murein L,D-transpeptidase YcbB/YkuD
MERWRWIPHDLGNRYVHVNIPDFMLDVFEDGRRIMTMKVVLGNVSWKTPVFAAELTDVIINPSWVAPSKILLKELINYIRADSNYFRNNKMKILQGYGKDEKEVDPDTIDWAEVDKNTLNFRLWQAPGALNIMGRLKFMIATKYDVFLHDTPYKEDFPKPVRGFSHGCIRIEKPVEFAEYLLRDHKYWTKERILAAIDSNIERTVPLKEHVPVRVLYSTAYLDDGGVIQFRDDYYNWDKKLKAAMSENRPKASDIASQKESSMSSSMVR